MKVLGIIPARFASTRLPGKPLVDIHGKTMIQRVYEQANKAFTSIVATDDERIEKEVKAFGGKVVRTSVEHNTGTNRCLEAYHAYTADNEETYEVIVNIQGDEPLIDPTQLLQVVNCFQEPETSIATLVKQVEEVEELFNENRVFVTFTDEHKALYFSRSVIPAVRGLEKTEWLNATTIYRHIGLYAYTPKALNTFAGLSQSSLEKAESLEQNRWLQNGYEVNVAVTTIESPSVDTPEDLEYVRSLISTNGES